MSISTSVLLVLKVFVLLGIALYAVFAGIMVRQEQLMENVLEDAFEPVLRVLTISHFIISIGLFLLALALL